MQPKKKHLSTSIKYRRFQEKYKKHMLAGILLHIIKLKMTYSHKNTHYGGYNQSRKVKPAIQNYKVPIKSVKMFYSRFKNYLYS